MGEPEQFEDRIIGERLLGGSRKELTILRLYRTVNKREMLTCVVPVDEATGHPAQPGPQETA